MRLRRPLLFLAVSLLSSAHAQGFLSKVFDASGFMTEMRADAALYISGVQILANGVLGFAAVVTVLKLLLRVGSALDVVGALVKGRRCTCYFCVCCRDY